MLGAVSRLSLRPLAGGYVASSKVKTAFIAELSIKQFLGRNFGHVFFWTFSEPGRVAGEPLWTKDEAESHFKAFRDLCSRRGIDLLVVWERQQRGAWHPHCLINRFLDVSFVRPWMVARGWGPQMRVELIKDMPWWQGGRMVYSGEGSRRVVKYLTKYLTKSICDEGDTKKKIFSASGRVKVGTTKFKWMATERAGAFLFAMGRGLFFQLYGRLPKFDDMMHVIRLGAEETQWVDVDPLWEFAFP